MFECYFDSMLYTTAFILFLNRFIKSVSLERKILKYADTAQ